MAPRHLDAPHISDDGRGVHKKSGRQSCELALGVTSRTSAQASPQELLRINRGHWAIENSCHYALDQTCDEDRCRDRTGHGPENTSRLRRFAISVLNLYARPGESIASMTRRLAAKTRLVFDYLLMTKNSTGHGDVAQIDQNEFTVPRHRWDCMLTVVVPNPISNAGFTRTWR